MSIVYMYSLQSDLKKTVVNLVVDDSFLDMYAFIFSDICMTIMASHELEYKAQLSRFVLVLYCCFCLDSPWSSSQLSAYDKPHNSS